MKYFTVLFVLAFVAGKSVSIPHHWYKNYKNKYFSGTFAGSPNTCVGVREDIDSLSDDAKKIIDSEIMQYKGQSADEIEEAMNRFAMTLIANDIVNANDRAVLEHILSPAVTGKGEIHIKGRFWGCYIEIHIKW